MTAPATRAVPVPSRNRASSPLRRAVTALHVGAAAAVALVAIGMFLRTSPDEGAFHYAGDYVLTADGIPYVLVLLTLLPALRTLQQRRDGALGRAGTIVAGVGAVVLLGMFVYGLIAATAGSLGPTYVLASLATIVGVALFAAGSWRTGLIPRRLLVCWPVAWAIGSMLPIWGFGPLLLAAVYVAMAVLLPRRVRREAA